MKIKAKVSDSPYSGYEEFEIVEDKPKIEAGSEWVSQSGSVLTVNYVGKHQLICTWNDTGKEFVSPIKNHTKFYKPKPKTVTMYFYKYGDEYYASPHTPTNYALAFTREIELP